MIGVALIIVRAQATRRQSGESGVSKTDFQVNRMDSLPWSISTTTRLKCSMPLLGWTSGVSTSFFLTTIGTGNRFAFGEILTSMVLGICVSSMRGLPVAIQE